MFTISICTVLMIAAFFSGYLYRVFSTERATVFPASEPPREEVRKTLISEPLSTEQAKILKDTFELVFGFPEQRFTRSVIFELDEMDIYIAKMREYLNSLPTGSKKKGIGAYFGLTTDNVRGVLHPDIVVPKNKMTIFLAPVLYDEDFEEDTFPGAEPGRKRRILKKGSIKSVFDEASEELPITDAPQLAFDISHTEP